MTTTLAGNKDIGSVARTAVHASTRSASDPHQWVQRSRSGNYNVILPFLLGGGDEAGPYVAIKARHPAVQAHESNPCFSPSIQTYWAAGKDHTAFFDLPRAAALELASDIAAQYTPQSFKNKP